MPSTGPFKCLCHLLYRYEAWKLTKHVSRYINCTMSTMLSRFTGQWIADKTHKPTLDAVIRARDRRWNCWAISFPWKYFQLLHHVDKSDNNNKRPGLLNKGYCFVCSDCSALYIEVEQSSLPGFNRRIWRSNFHVSHMGQSRYSTICILLAVFQEIA